MPEPAAVADRLRLHRFGVRPLVKTDLGLYLALYTDAETMKFIGPPLSTEQATTSFRVALRQNAVEQARTRFLVVGETSSGADLGVCGALFGVPRSTEAEVGIMLSHTARQRGISRGAFGKFIEHVFQSSECEQVWIRYARNHFAVERMADGLGFSAAWEPSNEVKPSCWREAFLRRSVWSTIANAD